MAYMTGTIQLTVYTDSAQTASPLENFPTVSKSFANSAILGCQPTVLTLAGAGTQTISTNGVGTVKHAYILSTATDLLVNINGLGNITFQAGEPAFIPATITSLVITNASASVSTVVTVTLIAS